MKRFGLPIALVIVAFLLGVWWSGSGEPTDPHAGHVGEMAGATEEQVEWTCSMHPNVRRSEFGDCPICGMDLIPVESGGDDNGAAPVLEMSERARALAEIETTPVERRFVAARVRMVGTVEIDETAMRYITARLPGRIERMYVNYTGIAVREGDHMVEIYSPELVSTQHELIQASGPDGSEVLSALRGSIRERLRLWGFSQDQIDDIESRREPSDNMTIRAPMSGVVIEQHLNEGGYVETGTRLYTIADLSQVWLNLDAYESDLPWLRYAQDVRFEVPARPGEAFEGRVSFIQPLLNRQTRTVKVRVVVDNSDGRLKPGMFVRATVEARVGPGGKVVEPDLDGKWIGPMHPRVISDEPGDCPICGMPLVRAESLGYDTEESAGDAPLVIPASVPLITGRRAVVYVEIEPGEYEGREVVLGPRAGDHYLVESGLEEGERVVTHGNFKIDSALQIRARPAMMSPGESTMDHVDGAAMEMEAASTEPLEITTGFNEAWGAVLGAYYEVQDALAADDLDKARAAAEKVVPAVDAAGQASGGLSTQAGALWERERDAIVSSANGIVVSGENIGEARTHFDTLSDSMIRLARAFGGGAGEAILMHCPMAFNDQGADWLQNHEDLLNPYFGDMMLRCGVEQERFTSREVDQKR